MNATDPAATPSFDATRALDHFVRALRVHGFTVADSWIGDDLTGPKPDRDLAFVHIRKVRNITMDRLIALLQRDDDTTPTAPDRLGYQFWRDPATYLWLGARSAFWFDTIKHLLLPWDAIVWVPVTELPLATAALLTASERAA